jgi:hypothetical protein
MVMSLKLGFDTNVLGHTTHKQEKLDTINFITLANHYGLLDILRVSFEVCCTTCFGGIMF